jgi:hypothetical protein
MRDLDKQMEQTKSRPPSIIQLLITASFLLVIMAYVVIALNTKDVIWFWPVFNEQSYELIINCYGEEILLHQGSQHHAAITTLFNDQLSGTKNWDSLTMSDDSYTYYQSSNDVVVLEFHYSPNVRIHSSVSFFKNVDTLVMPLAGRHSSTRAIFGRTLGVSTAGSFHVSTIQPLINYLEIEGLCEFKP